MDTSHVFWVNNPHFCNFDGEKMVLAVFWNSYFPNPLLVCPIELNLSLFSKLQFSLKISILLSCLLLRDQTLVICHSCHGHRTWQMNYEVQINRRFLFFLYAASLKLKNHLLRAKKKLSSLPSADLLAVAVGHPLVLPLTLSLPPAP